MTFAAGASLSLTLVLLLATGLVALRFARRAPRPERLPGRWWMLGAGAVLGVLLWHVAGEIGGDGLFHLARVRKLEAFDSLSLEAVDEFADGGLHPGYAFPLWHGFLALVARVAFLDPADVVLHEASVLAPLALLVAYEAGLRALPPRRPGGRGRLRPGGGDRARAGARRRVHRARRCRRRRRGSCWFRLRSRWRSPTSSGRRAACSPRRPPPGFVLAVIHPTYAIFLWLPVRGLPRRPLARRAGRGEEDRRRRWPRSSFPPPPFSPGCCLSSGTRPRTRPARTSCSARSSSTRASSTSSPTRATGWRRRSSGARVRSRSPRSSSCRSPGSRCGGAGRPMSSAASSRSRR